VVRHEATPTESLLAALRELREKTK
jgi:hypothetical protein